jgi:alcohol dehydrogenase class IV
MEVNVRALRQRQPQSEALARYAEAARLLTAQANASAEDAVTWVRSLCTDLQVPPLRTYGITPSDAAALCEKASQSSSMKGNPLPLTPEELREVLAKAL